MTDQVAINGMIQVLEIIKKKIDTNTSLIYCGYNETEDLLNSIVRDISNLKQKQTHTFNTIANRFLPTTDFQELSIENGWGDEYLILAATFDKCYYKWLANQKPKEDNLRSKIKRWFS